MKKLSFFPLMALLLSLGACATDDDCAVQSPTPIEQDPHLVSVDTAAAQLNALLSSMDEGTRAEVRRSEPYPTAILYDQGIATRSEDTPTKPMFYIFNIENEGGFALVSTDSRTSPVYAVTDSGSYDPETPIDNPGYNLFLERAETYYYNEIAEAGGIVMPWPDTPIGPGWQTTARLEALINTRWHQREPYNNECFVIPDVKAPTGCCPLATAQIIARNRFPASYENYTFHWDEILTEESIDNENTTAARDVARLLSVVGELLNTDYFPLGSSAFGIDIPDCLDDLGYTSCGEYIEGYNLSRIKISLRNDSPVYIEGHSASSSVGHAWIIDAYLRQEGSITMHIRNEDRTYTPIEVPTSRELVHCVWGWTGGHSSQPKEGYYLSGVFEPDNPIEILLSETRADYNTDICIVVDIEK